VSGENLLAREIVAFLRQIDWSLSSDSWKYDRISEIIDATEIVDLARQAKWDARFMVMAKLISTNSKDPHHRYGCVLVDAFQAVLATGYNGLPRGVDDGVGMRFERPAKYFYMVHAEQNAVADAARRGMGLAGTTAYIHDRFPCANCAGLLIQAGVCTVVGREPDLAHPRWGGSWRVALEMLGEAGVEVRYLEVEKSLGTFLEAPFG
jgi:dCMP deaminase